MLHVVAQQFDRGLRHRVDVADREEASVDAVLDQLRNPADCCRKRRHAAGHGFKRRKAEGLEFAGHQHQVGERQDVAHARQLAEEMNAVLDALPLGDPLGLRAVGSITDQQQPCWNLVGDAGKDFDNIDGAFYRPEVRKMDENLLAGFGKLGAAGGADFGIQGRIDVAVNEIRNHFDLAFHAEFVNGLLAQVIGDGRDAVALVDAEARNRAGRSGRGRPA